MADEKETLKKKITDLKAQLAQNLAAGKDPRKDPTLRQLRKTLKRAQRRLIFLTPLSFEQKVDRVGKLTELLNKRIAELVPTGAKKMEGNPYVHSIRKKLKSLNKRKKKLDRIAKKKAEKAVVKAAAAAPVAVSAPAAAEPEKK